VSGRMFDDEIHGKCYVARASSGNRRAGMNPSRLQCVCSRSHSGSNACQKLASVVQVESSFGQCLQTWTAGEFGNRASSRLKACGISHIHAKLD
jgi:hypothetical protein